MEMVRAYCDDLANAYLNLADPSGKPLWVLADRKMNLVRDAKWAAQRRILKIPYSHIGEMEEQPKHYTTVMRAVKDFFTLIEPAWCNNRKKQAQ
jgi:hypothetical protein